jgi:hypothetical protein
LVGAGGNGDLQTIVKNVGADLAMTISNSLGPKSKQKGESYIRRDAKSVFMDRPSQVIQEPKRGLKDMIWFMATPKNVLGVEKQNWQMSIGVGGMQTVMRTTRKSFRVGVSSSVSRVGARPFATKLGTRGRQSVRRVERIVVQRGNVGDYVEAISKNRVGRLRATFAYTASMLGKTRISPWIKDKFASVSSDGAAIFDQSKLNDNVAPSLSFGGSAPGLIENFEGMVLEAIDRAADQLYQVTSAIIHGYAKDYESGRKITSKANWMKNKQ